MSREAGFRTVYVSLTRGEGGQNLIGSELGPELGLIRTRELMAARQIDGGEQYFTRAPDFGYSKTSEETLKKWNKDEVMDDLVSVIRSTRPDVIICRFPPDSRAGHGHHAASAILAKEAFECAADSTCFSASASEFGAWKARSLYWNTYRFGSNNTIQDNQPKVDAGGYDPIAGFSNGEIAAKSRSQHKSQGFGVALQRGNWSEYFSPVAGDTSMSTPFDKLQPKWNELKEGKKILSTIQACINRFDFRNPSLSIPQLLELRHQFLHVEKEPWISPKMAELERLIADCAGLWVSAYSYSDRVAINDTAHIQVQAIVRNFPTAVLDIQPEKPGEPVQSLELNRQVMVSKAIIRTAPGAMTQPVWLENLSNSRGSEETSIAPWPNPAMEIPVVLKMNNHQILYRIPVEHKSTDPVKGELISPLIVTPRVTGQLSENLSVFPSPEERTFKLRLKYYGHAKSSIIVKLAAFPDSLWKVTIKDTTIDFTEHDQEVDFFFRSELLKQGGHVFECRFMYSLSDQPNIQYELHTIREITYDHIPKITWFPKATLQCRAVRMDIGRRKSILYIKGAGDGVASTLRQIGYSITETSSIELDTLNMSRFDVVVTGIRAFNTDKGLSSMHNKLMSFVQDGGRMVVQYNTNSNLHPGKVMAPFPFSITRNRTTEEDAPVQIVDDLHSLFTQPNKITLDDFKGWIQERSLYQAGNLDPAYKDLVMMHDQGEEPTGGSLIQCDYGKGSFIYTGLSFFRQLPAGHPGSIRLFANLLGD